MTHLRLDTSWWRPAGGDAVLAGSPLTLFRLTSGGVRVAEALERGDELPSGHEPLTARLLDVGAVHPDVTRDAGHGADDDADGADGTDDDGADIDVVIPVHDEDTHRVRALVACLRPCRGIGEIVVVDDASAVPVAPITGARVLRLDHNLGPAGARNAGIAATSAPALLFVDADVMFTDSHNAVAILRRHLADERVALVAPRVAAAPTPGTLGAFDAVRSPLDLGAEPARIRPLTRVGYVPAATMLVRRTALQQLGGFDESMRLGEDVDLVWRLDESGWRCRYEPAAVAHHTVRPTFRRWWQQRLSYGTSAAPLARRHGAAVAPLRLSRWSAAAWAGGAIVHPLVGLAIGGATTAEFARRLGDVPARAAIASRYAGRGHLYAGRLIARALTRSWWPLALVAALASRRARRALALAAVVPPLVEWATARPQLDPLRYVSLSLADDVAYGTGVWIGAWRERSAAALAPSLTR